MSAVLVVRLLDRTGSAVVPSASGAVPSRPLDLVAAIQRSSGKTALSGHAQLGRFLQSSRAFECRHRRPVITDPGASEYRVILSRLPPPSAGLRASEGRLAASVRSGVRSERRARSRSVCLLSGRLPWPLLPW